MILVSIPVWNTPADVVAEALDCVLANRHVSRVVVTLDGPGQDAPRHADPRVLIWELDRNRGRYYVDDVVSRACRLPLFTVHDADDLADPGRLDAMAQVQAHVVYTDRETVHLDGRIQRRPAKRHPGPTLDIIWGQMALYRTDWLAGLYHPGFRVSWDAVLDNLAYRYAVCRKANAPLLYRIRKRPGSLTTDPASALRSDYRRAVAVLHRQMWDWIEATCTTRDDAARYISAVTDRTLAADRDRDVARLEARMDRGRT